MPTPNKVTLAPSDFRLGFLVHDVSRMRRTVIDNAMKPYGITRSQWWVLANLSRHADKPTPQCELAKLLDIGKVGLGKLVDRLEANGYVERQSTEMDRRVKLICLTSKGRQLLFDIESVTRGLNQETIMDIPAEDILRSQETLSRMKQRLIQMNKNFNEAHGRRVAPEHMEPGQAAA